MQTITENDTNLSIFIYEDEDSVFQNYDNIISDRLTIWDRNASNTTLHTGVTPPTDWQGEKYFFDGTNWAINPAWQEPTEDFLAAVNLEGSS